MEMKVMKVLVAILLVLCVPVEAKSVFILQQNIASGNFGSEIGEFGFEHQESKDDFPENYYLLLDGTVIISDKINGRVAVYNDNKIKNTLICVQTENGKWNGICNISGRYISTIKDNNIITEEDGKYFLFSETGNVLEDYVSESDIGIRFGTPIILSKDDSVTYARIGSIKYKFATNDYVYDVKIDKVGDIFGLATAMHTEYAWHYRVYKYDKCMNVLASIDFPSRQVKEVPISDDITAEPMIQITEEYGPPIVGPDGSIYTYKRTPTTYSILKWTWVDSPDDPKGGPDAPADLKVAPATTGLTVTWTASPQDPGCVEGYEVERSSTSGGLFSNLTTTAPGVVSYSDTGVLPGSSAFYRVRAKSSCGPSDYTAVIGGARP